MADRETTRLSQFIQDPDRPRCVLARRAG
ncbi:MAG: hypothetical protein QOJ42_389, partial [Acidobacteriaceae bacterium]|nr:hypothetical protein [Acidobacteriaceae bacterium]